MEKSHTYLLILEIMSSIMINFTDSTNAAVAKYTNAQAKIITVTK